MASCFEMCGVTSSHYKHDIMWTWWQLLLDASLKPLNAGWCVQMVKWGLFCSRSTLRYSPGGLGAGPDTSWLPSMRRQVPPMPVIHTVLLQVPHECPSISLPLFPSWLSRKEGRPPSLQGRANSNLAHPSLLMSGASCGQMFRDWHSTGHKL